MRHDRTVPVLLALGCAALLSACGPGVTLTRTVPAPYNLGPVKKVAIVDVRGSSDHEQERFLTEILYESSRRGFYQVVDARPYGVRIADLREPSRSTEKLRRDVNADVYLEARLYGCRSRLNSEVVKEKDKEGNKVSRTKYWYRAECGASLTLVDAKGRDVASFEVEGDESSYKSDEPESYKEEITLNEAIDEAGQHAVSQFTPRTVTEDIRLEKDAPLAKEGIQEIEAGRYTQARVLWEGALKTSAGSAALQYNLGAVCEALGDTRAARRYYEEAIQLASGNEKYREALSKLEDRERDAEALRKKPRSR